MIEATIVCDSVSPDGKRLTTFKLRYPKFVHGEFMTHRVVSRNASSSRAIPTRKLIEEVRSDALRATFVHWGRDQKGMGTTNELEGDDFAAIQDIWRRAALDAAGYAERMVEKGAAKQLVNRLLEPFSHINVVATATEWDNFFGLRLHPTAQPEMRALAVAMFEAKKASRPRALVHGLWHLPFATWATGGVKEHDDAPTRAYANENNMELLEVLKRVSVARTARVSYESFETGKRSTVEEDVKLCGRLIAQGHWSPFEHQATPDRVLHNPIHDYNHWEYPREHGNLVGWRQLRKTLPGEAVALLPEEYA